MHIGGTSTARLVFFACFAAIASQAAPDHVSAAPAAAPSASVEIETVAPAAVIDKDAANACVADSLGPDDLGDSLEPSSTSVSDSHLEAVPAEPQWPAGDLPGRVRDLLTGFYSQRAVPSVSDYTYRAPRGEADKRTAWKDPDTLWEYYGGDVSETACHSASTDQEFIDCTGHRLAKTFGLSYSGDLTLFNAARGYYTNDAYAQMAGYYAIYHYFVLKFDAPADTDLDASPARDNKAYHRRMIKAYEAHMRNILLKMFYDPAARASPDFQASMTRAIGLTATIYTAVLQAMEEERIWPKDSWDRAFAIATLNGINQRLFWEWITEQKDGPRTAGVTPLGSHASYAAEAAAHPQYVGTDAFYWGATRFESLRPDALNVPPYDRLVVDGDYTIPGEWWCYGAYSSTNPDRAKCIGQALRESLGGARSPFGQYYSDASCGTRPGSYTPHSCGDTSLGSIAEEWTWSFVGARKGMYLVKALTEAGAPQAPSGAIGPGSHDIGSGASATEYQMATDRAGYGISGWHGGEGRQDDLEWTWHQEDGKVQAIRTLSAGTHDFETQNGRYSLGEADTATHSTGRDGSTWAGDRQDYPGGMENHSPGPSPLYGTLLFGLTLWDQVDDPSGDVRGGLAGSFYDTSHRNHPDEFSSWVWLLQSTYYRCADVADPLDSACAAFTASKRKPLFHHPSEAMPANLPYLYLWRDPDNGTGAPLVDRNFIGAGDPTGSGWPTCREGTGLPWRSVYDLAASTDFTVGDSLYMLSEGGYGAYNNLIQGLGGFMRVVAHRYPLSAPSPDLAAAYQEQRNKVLKPWYDEAYGIVRGILDLYKNDYGYVPDIENSTCLGPDPLDPGQSTMLAWRYGTGASVHDTVIRRAQWYSILAVWYLWYDSDWLDVDPDVWLAP